MIRKIKPPHKTLCGVTLIEVLVSLFVLSLLLLSLDAVQLLSFKNTQAVYYFNMAVQRADLLLAHPDREGYFSEWQAENKAFLPQVESVLMPDNLIIVWGGMHLECEHSVMEKAGCLNVSI